MSADTRPGDDTATRTAIPAQARSTETSIPAQAGAPAAERPNRQLQLPGQVAAPDGPIDLDGMFLMHFAFRRDLTAFTDAASRTPASAAATWRALSRRWQRLSFMLHKHHTAEDAGLWPLVIERANAAGDTEGVSTLTAMEAEHQGIGLLLNTCSSRFATLAATGHEALRTQLQRDLTELDALLTQHLAHEETGALPLVQQYLTPEDWTRLEKEYFSKGYKPWDIPFALCWVLHQVPSEVREKVFGRKGVPPRRVWKLLRPGFKRRERKAFRYV